MGKVPGDPILMAKIGVRVKQLRLERKLSHREVLIESGINITRIEAGKRDLSVTSLQKLCNFFGITFIEFFKGIKD